MESITAWLKNMEHAAADLYHELAIRYRDAGDISSLFEELAKDEQAHGNVMVEVEKVLRRKPDIALNVTLDDATKATMNDSLDRIRRRLSSPEAKADSFLEDIIDLEFSEWNDVFAYVLKSLAEENRSFVTAIAEIQRHKRRIGLYLEDRPEYRRHLSRIRALPSMLKEKILVVDDEPAIVNLLKAMLRKEGCVETAANGQVGLKKTEENYYRLIISDVDMPVMSGIEFYRNASSRFPKINERFLFFTGNLTPELESFFSKNNLRYLSKPASLSHMQREVVSILHSL